FRLVRVHHENRKKLGRLLLAGIGADAVAVAGELGVALSGLVGRERSVVDLSAAFIPAAEKRGWICQILIRRDALHSDEPAMPCCGYPSVMCSSRLNQTAAPKARAECLGAQGSLLHQRR